MILKNINSLLIYGIQASKIIHILKRCWQQLCGHMLLLNIFPQSSIPDRRFCLLSIHSLKKRFKSHCLVCQYIKQSKIVVEKKEKKLTTVNPELKLALSKNITASPKLYNIQNNLFYISSCLLKSISSFGRKTGFT